MSLSLRPCSLMVLASLALGACVPPAPEPTPAPTPSPTASITPVLAPRPEPEVFANWADAPATRGDWHFSGSSRQAVAEFRSPAGGQIFVMNCTASRQIALSAVAHVPGANAITIRTETTDRALRADSSDNSVTAMLPASDPLLEAMAFSKGRFAVLVTGGPQLFLPAWPEVTRVIEECRS